MDIYRDIERICKAHDLRFYAVYGTALGAVRHKGFIPWDDDLDLAMPRYDYMRFLEIAENKLPDYLRVISIYKNPKDYHLMFAKILYTRDEVIARVQKESNLSLSQGLFVDIFPMDGHPRSTIDFFMWAVKRAILRRRKSVTELDNWFRRFDYDSSPCVNWCLDNYSVLKRRMVSAMTFGDGVDVPFGNATIRIPSCVDVHLRSEYGDYMKLPPESERIPSHQIL